MIYDYIIVGAGIGGLSAGLNLIANNKKVLILEKNSLPGGLASTFKKGRFEFDTTIWDLYDFGNSEHIGEIQKLFQKYGLTTSTKLIPFNNRIKVLDTNEDYEIKGEFEEFVLWLEQQNPGSMEPIREFIKITKEVHDALECIKANNYQIEENFPNFTKYLDYNALNALIDLKIPRDTIHKMSYLWLEIGSPLNKLNFIDYANFMYKLIFKKTVVLNDKNIALALEMAKQFQTLGGKIHYNTKVIEIIEDSDTETIKTSDGKEYKAKHVICDLSKRYVFKELIKKTDKDINRLENARTLSPNGIYVYLGLNQDHKALNLTNYHYYQFNTLNSEQNVAKMTSLKHSTFEAIVPNVVCDNASPENTTILVLRTSYFGNVFDKVNKNNYYKVKEELAKHLIDQFEEAFKVDVKNYIEEISIATPFTFERLTNNINGSFMGYMRLGYDNSIHRLISEEDEKLANLSFVGNSAIFGGGFDNAFYSGYYVTEKLLNQKGSENNGE